MIVTKEMSLTQKVFVVKQFYKSNENLKKMCKQFEVNFNVALAETAAGIFHSLILTFEHTGSVPANTFYFEDLATKNSPANPKTTLNHVQEHESFLPAVTIKTEPKDDEDTDTEVGEYPNDDQLYNNHRSQTEFLLTPSRIRVTTAAKPNPRTPTRKEKASTNPSKTVFVGARFNTLEQIRDALIATNLLHFRSGTSLTTDCMRRHNKRIALLAPSKIKHAYGNWICKFEKKKPFVERECKAFIVASLAEDGQQLEIKKLIDHTIHH